MPGRFSRAITPNLLFGLFALMVGVGLLLVNFGYVRVRSLWDFFPALFVFIGLLDLIRSKYWGGRVSGLILIAGGSYWLLDNFGFMPFPFGKVWPALLILFGVFLLSQAARRRTDDDQFAGSGTRTGTMETGVLRETAIFGGGKRALITDDFRGGEALATFGGLELDLTGAQMKTDEAYLEASAYFGGVMLRIPSNWIVNCQGTAILGGYEDKTRPTQDPSRPTKSLVIRGTAVLGGVEIQN